jgi:hypothetical protein
VNITKSQSGTHSGCKSNAYKRITSHSLRDFILGNVGPCEALDLERGKPGNCLTW